MTTRERFLKLAAVVAEYKGEILKTISGWTMFTMFDWIVGIAAFIITGILVKAGMTYWPIFLIFWPIWTILSWLVVLASKKSNNDFTLCERYAVFSKAALKKIWLFPGFLIAIVSPFIFSSMLIGAYFLVIWYGPGPVAIFIEKYRRLSKKGIWLILTVAAGIQMMFWTKAYILGIGAWDMIKLFIRSSF